MVLSLTLISAVLAFLLGLVYVKTKKPIEQAQQKKIENAIKSVFGDYDSLQTMRLKPDDGKDTVAVYTVWKDSAVAGTMVETYTTRGYGGKVSLLTAFNAGDSITAIIVIDNKETPGLGSRIVEKTFLEQFMNISFDSLPGNKFSVKKDGGSIDALTGATISSRALCDALNRAKSIKDGSSGPQVFPETKDSCCIKDINILKEAMPEFDNNPLEGPISSNGLQIFVGMKGPVPCGYAVKTFSEGYNGNIWLLVGFKADGSIYKINVLKHTETNGRGSRISEDDFLEQFYGLNPDKNNIKVSDEGGEIDAITASTISSAAFCKAIDNAWKALKKGGLK